MFLKKIVWLALLAAAVVLPALAQEQPVIEYGQSGELRGVKKIFVDTGIDSQQRELIVKAIGKRLPDLEAVSRPEESDIHLRFSLVQTKDGKTKEIGTVVKLIGNNRVRVLLSFKDFLFPAFGQEEPTTSRAQDYTKPYMFAIEFVEAYKKANGGR
jgi:hypothetical protein